MPVKAQDFHNIGGIMSGWNRPIETETLHVPAREAKMLRKEIDTLKKTIEKLRGECNQWRKQAIKNLEICNASVRDFHEGGK
jgi:hypothetical protein